MDNYNETGIFYSGTVLVSLEWMQKNLPADLYTIDADAFVQSSNPDQTEQDVSDLLGGAKNIFLTGPDGERIELWEYTGL